MKDLMWVLVLIVVLGGVLFIAGKLPKSQETDTEVTEEPMTQTLQIETVQEGTGEGAKVGDTVSVHYTGTFTSGEVFDSSIPRGEPIAVVLGAGSVIPGWEQGLLGMKVGEKRKLTIPPDLAYGPNDYRGIPGNSTLIFDVELVALTPAVTE